VYLQQPSEVHELMTEALIDGMHYLINASDNNHKEV